MLVKCIIVSVYLIPKTLLQVKCIIAIVYLTLQTLLSVQCIIARVYLTLHTLLQVKTCWLSEELWNVNNQTHIFTTLLELFDHFTTCMSNIFVTTYFITHLYSNMLVKYLYYNISQPRCVFWWITQHEVTCHHSMLYVLLSLPSEVICILLQAFVDCRVDYCNLTSLTILQSTVVCISSRFQMNFFLNHESIIGSLTLDDFSMSLLVKLMWSIWLTEHICSQ